MVGSFPISDFSLHSCVSDSSLDPFIGSVKRLRISDICFAQQSRNVRCAAPPTMSRLEAPYSIRSHTSRNVAASASVFNVQTIPIRFSSSIVLCFELEIVHVFVVFLSCGIACDIIQLVYGLDAIVTKVCVFIVLR